MPPNEKVKKLRDKKNQILSKYNEHESLNKSDTDFIKTLMMENYKKDFINDVVNLYPKKVQKHKQSFITCVAQMKSKKKITLRLEDCFNKLKDKNFDSQKFKIGQAFRKSIQNQIFHFKQNNKTEFNKDFVVDHIIPFHKIVSDFLKKQNLKHEDVKIYYCKNEKSYKLKDEKLKNDFEKYHNDNAQLQMLSKEENLKKVEKDYKV